jgi:hypothetical protein
LTMFLSSWLSWALSRSHARRAKRRNPASRPKTARLFLEQLEDRALPSAYTANTVSDLINDINAANAAGGSNTITLAAPTTAPYALTAVNNTTIGSTGLPVIAANDTLTIAGNGDTIERSAVSGTPDFNLFDVAAGAGLTLENLTLQNGLAYGAGTAAEGGAIYSQGALGLNGVTVQDNVALGSNGQKNIVVKVQGAGSIGAGGGLFVAGGTVTLTKDRFIANTAQGGQGAFPFWANEQVGGAGGTGVGGGLDVVGGTVTLTSDTFSSNTAQGGQGGGNSANAQEFSYGTGPVGGGGFGGALAVSGGTVTVTSSTLSSNTAKGGQGGPGGEDGETGVGTPKGGAGGAAQGGALEVSGGAVSVASTTLSANTAQGGQGSEGPDTGRLDPSAGGAGGAAQGGALEVSGGTVTLTSTTVSSNTALGGQGGPANPAGGFAGPAGASDGGGLYIGAGADVDLDSFTVAHTTKNSAAVDPNIDGTYSLT